MRLFIISSTYKSWMTRLHLIAQINCFTKWNTVDQFVDSTQLTGKIFMFETSFPILIYIFSRMTQNEKHNRFIYLLLIEEIVHKNINSNIDFAFNRVLCNQIEWHSVQNGKKTTTVTFHFCVKDKQDKKVGMNSALLCIKS